MPCINSNLKISIFFKKKFLTNIKNSNSKTWEQYMAQTNLVNKTKRNLSAHTFKKDVLVEQNQIIFGKLISHTYPKEHR